MKIVLIQIILVLGILFINLPVHISQPCPEQYLAHKKDNNSSDFQCIHCNQFIPYCELCDNKNFCLQCEDNYQFLNGACTQNQEQFTMRRSLSNDLEEPKEYCVDPSCYDYSCECCSGGSYIGIPLLKKTINPLITHLIVKKKENSYQHYLLTEAMLMYQMKFYIYYLESSGDDSSTKKYLTEDTDYTYWVKDVTLQNDNDLWKFEIHVNYTEQHDQILHLLLIMYNKVYRITGDLITDTEISVPLCQLDYDPNTTSVATYKYYQISEQYSQTMDDQSDLSQWASLFAYVFALATTFEGGCVGFRSINSIQISYLVKFCNQTLPPVVERILLKENEMIDYTIFHVEEKTSDKIEMEDRFYDWELSPFIINNSGEYIFILVVILGTSLIVFLLNQIFERKKMLILNERPNLSRKQKMINYCKKM